MKVKFYKKLFEFNNLTDDNLLGFLEKNGENPKFMCRDGYCHECKMILKNGQVKHKSYAIMPESGYFLPCCSQPINDIEIEEAGL